MNNGRPNTNSMRLSSIYKLTTEVLPAPGVTMRLLLTALLLLLQPHPASTQDTPVGTTQDPPSEGTTQDPLVTETPRTPAPPCDRTGPITINTYGCGAGVEGTAGQQDLAGLESRLSQLTGRVSQLEGVVNQLIAGGGTGGTGGSGGGGGTGGITIIGQRFTDCEDIRRNGTTTNGVYDIWPLAAPSAVKVLCEFDTGVGVAVIQARNGGLVNFQRGWQEYKKGFGTLEFGGSFWLGLDPIHYLTNQEIQYRLIVDLLDWDGGRRQAIYRSFSIGPETDRYRLKIYFYDDPASTAGDPLSNYHQWLPFSTFDSDNDYAPQNCAIEHSGGWWYRDCDNANLNGFFHETPSLQNAAREDGIEWDTWRPLYSLRAVSMKLQREFPPDSFDSIP